MWVAPRSRVALRYAKWPFRVLSVDKGADQGLKRTGRAAIFFKANSTLEASKIHCFNARGFVYGKYGSSRTQTLRDAHWQDCQGFHCAWAHLSSAASRAPASGVAEPEAAAEAGLLAGDPAY